MRRWLILLFVLVLASLHATAGEKPFAVRGYYTTFMRSPTFGLPEWKQMIDCMHEDQANFLFLWTAGAFRSKKFPITWKYNAEHKNVQQDFVRELIDYAHERGIKVVLGFTPFAYDGTNQYPLEHPDLKATQKNGEPAALWGMHAWGHNLCPARPAAQAFMLDYIREMFFDFYPNADGLLIESSDYAICHCAECRGTFFDREFQFARQISDDVWRAKPDATIFVFPRYFSNQQVPEFGVAGSRQKLDGRWSMMFTPHSAHIDDTLAAQAKTSLFWNDALTIGTPARIGEGTRTARQHRLSGYITSCEPFSCVDGPPGSNKSRQKPFHFGWLQDGQMPLNELLIRVNRLAYREYTNNPNISVEDFHTTVSRKFFPADRDPRESVADLLFLQESWFEGANWFQPTLLLCPRDLQLQAQREHWPAGKIKTYTDRIDRVRAIARRYQLDADPTRKEMARIAGEIVRRWDDAASDR